MNINLLKLADKEETCSGTRVFNSNVNNTALYACVYVEWCECGKTALKKRFDWDCVKQTGSKGIYVIVACCLTKQQVTEWLKENIKV